MRDETSIALAVFVMILLIIAALSYLGYGKWEGMKETAAPQGDLPPSNP